MMIDFNTILIILLIHWLADFSLQTDEQAKGKSTSVRLLFSHVIVYSLVWFGASYYLLGGEWTKPNLETFTKCGIFAAVTFAAHFITDFVTSRVGKPLWEKGDLHNGFVVVGFDQLLHYLQLFGTYILLK